MERGADIGWWWLSDAPDARVPGVLDTPENGASILVVNGNLIARDTHQESFQIHGETPEHGRVTLASVLPAGTRTRLDPRIVQQSFECWTTILGGHVDVAAPLAFKAASVSVEGLDDWVYAGTYLRSKFDNAGRVIVEPSSPLPPSDPAQVDGFDVAIRVSDAFPFGGQRDMSVGRSSGVVVTPGQMSRGLEDLNRIVRGVQDLISLLRGDAVRIGRIWLDPINTPEAPEDEEEYTPPMQVIQYGRFHQFTVKRAAPYRVVRSYAQVAHRWRDVVRRWFDLIDRARASLEVFFASRYFTEISIENEFLYLVQAAEAFHRACGDGLYMNADDYGTSVLPTLVSAIPAHVTPSLREALKSRMRYGNEHSLRKRLGDLVARIPDELAHVFRRHKEFVAAVVDTRNYRIHMDPEGAGGAWNSDQMWVLSDHLHTLMKIIFLSELGFTGGEIAEGLHDDVRRHLQTRPHFA